MVTVSYSNMEPAALQFILTELVLKWCSLKLIVTQVEAHLNETLLRYHSSTPLIFHSNVSISLFGLLDFFKWKLSSMGISHFSRNSYYQITLAIDSQTHYSTSFPHFYSILLFTVHSFQSFQKKSLLSIHSLLSLASLSSLPSLLLLYSPALSFLSSDLISTPSELRSGHWPVRPRIPLFFSTFTWTTALVCIFTCPSDGVVPEFGTLAQWSSDLREPTADARNVLTGTVVVELREGHNPVSAGRVVLEY